MMILDGVYTPAKHKPHFHRVNAPSAEQLRRLQGRIISRVVRYLIKARLLIDDPEQPWLDIQPQDTLDHLAAAASHYRIAIGPGSGQRNLTITNPALARQQPATAKPFTADRDGFSLNAAVACEPHQRDRLERLCRYVTRPALALDRLSTNAAGQVLYALKHPWRDGSTHVLFSPLDFIARLAALIPRPRANLTRYHGVFAPNSKLRPLITPGQQRSARRAARTPEKPAYSADAHEHINDSDLPLAPLTWAQRLRRVFNIDIERCPHCGGQLRHIADIIDPDVIRRILHHLQQRAPPAPLRAPRTDSNLTDLFA